MSLNINNGTLNEMFRIVDQSLKDGVSGAKTTVGMSEGYKIGGRGWVPLGRRDETFKAENQRARGALLNALMDEFGVKDKKSLPKSVLKALNLSNFETSRRPLTTRRIAAIQSAVIEEKGRRSQMEMSNVQKPKAPVATKVVTPEMRKAQFAGDGKISKLLTAKQAKYTSLFEGAMGEIMRTGMRTPPLDARDVDRYETFLRERGGDRIGALYDLMNEKGVPAENLRPRYRYPGKLQPQNRAEELDPKNGFQSEATNAWMDDLDIDAPLNIGALLEKPKPTEAGWVAEADGKLNSYEGEREGYVRIKQQVEAPIPGTDRAYSLAD